MGRASSAGTAGGSGTLDGTIMPGDPISLRSLNNLVRHVSVVTAVSGGHGTITTADANAAANGSGTITVTNGAMQLGLHSDVQWARGLAAPSL